MGLKTIRESRGLTQHELAKRVGATQQAVSQWESGANAFSTETLIKLTEALACSADEILGIKNSRSGSPAVKQTTSVSGS